MINKSIIYYTDNRLDQEISLLAQQQLLKSGLPVASCSLMPMNFGKNIVLPLSSGPTTMFQQILAALKASEGQFIFFCEHDVLYHTSHFEFTPPREDVFYYNTNVWRWDQTGDKVITYDHFRSVSGLCVARETAIEHYEKRLKLIYEKGWDKVVGRNPKWARTMGYEPGKPKRNGGFSDDEIDEWRSKYPNIDIRHKKTLTPIKMNLDSFVHKPTGWKQSTLDKIPGWDIKEILKLN
jgi:hypothetical protein